MKSLTFGLCALVIKFASAYQGDMTYYTPGFPSDQQLLPGFADQPPGLGSCGYTNSASDAIVALSTEIMNNPPNPNDNPICGTSINIYNPATGDTNTATIVDTCEGCGEYDIDVSPSVFEAVDPNGLADGRIVVDWGGPAVGGKKRDLNGKMSRVRRFEDAE